MNPNGMLAGRPATAQAVYSQAQQMLQSPADLVTQSSQLRDLVRNLPPDRGELLSRPAFERAALVSLCANFFDVPDGLETDPQQIRVPYDCWVRAVQCIALPAVNATTVGAVGLFPTAFERSQLSRYGTNFRGLVEVNWKLNGKQGFVSTGLAEILAPAPLVTGDGEHSAPLDWRLQQEETIAVRCRVRFDRLQPPTCVQPPIERTIPWVAVIFWAVDSSGQGVRSG